MQIVLINLNQQREKRGESCNLSETFWNERKKSQQKQNKNILIKLWISVESLRWAS